MELGHYTTTNIVLLAANMMLQVVYSTSEGTVAPLILNVIVGIQCDMLVELPTYIIEFGDFLK